VQVNDLWAAAAEVIERGRCRADLRSRAAKLEYGADRCREGGQRAGAGFREPEGRGESAGSGRDGEGAALGDEPGEAADGVAAGVRRRDEPGRELDVPEVRADGAEERGEAERVEAEVAGQRGIERDLFGGQLGAGGDDLFDEQSFTITVPMTFRPMW
jgi:hypothetical protein